MKNAEQWQPTKYEFYKGALRGSRNARYLNPGSRLIVDAVARHYQRAFPLYAKGHLLDLGSGTVPFYAAYQSHINENTCVDWGNSLHLQAYLDQECDLTQPLPFADHSFDTILLSDVLEHIPNPADLWHEMARLLRPGGTILLNVPFYYWVHEEPYDYYRYTEFALRRFAEHEGLEVLSVEPVGGLPEVIADLVAKGIFQVPLIGKPLAIAAQATVAAFVRTASGRRVSSKTGRRYPLGYFMVARK